MLVYVLYLKTESCDEYIWAFNRRPTEDEVYNTFLESIPDEVTPDEEDKWGYAQNWRIEKLKVETLD